MLNMQTIDSDENSRRKTIITSIRNIQLMVIEGYETYSTRSDFEMRLKVKKNPYLELVLPKMPVSWVACPAEEPPFEEYLERSAHRISNEALDRYARLTRTHSQAWSSLLEYREQLDPLHLMRIESSINHLFRPVLAEEERLLLDEQLDFIMESNPFANYFLSYLSYRMKCSGSNQMQIDYLGFVGLKDKYLKMLSSSPPRSPGIDSNDLRIALVGELIFSASQIYYRSANGELVSLIEHLDCPIMKEYKIWEIYFLYRVCKSSVANVLSKQHFLCIA